MGCFTIAMDRNPLAAARADADVFCCNDPGDFSQVAASARQYEADAVLPLSEFGVVPAAKASEELGLRHISSDAARTVHNKILMRRAWARAGLDQPRFFVASCIQEAINASMELRFPLIVKPADLSGARGVRRVDSDEDMASAYEEVALLSTDGVLLEEYIEGVEASIEGVVTDGRALVLAYSDKELRAHPNYRVTRSINYPGAFDPEQVKKIRECAQAAVDGLGLRNSPFHLEVFVVGDRVLPIECGARGGGGHIYSVIVKAVSGVDLVQTAVRILLGESPGVSSPAACLGACYRFLFPPEGEFVSVKGVEAVLDAANVIDLAIPLEPGAPIREPENGAQRAGYLVTKGSDRLAAVETADWAEGVLQWTIA